MSLRGVGVSPPARAAQRRGSCLRLPDLSALRVSAAAVARIGAGADEDDARVGGKRAAPSGPHAARAQIT